MNNEQENQNILLEKLLIQLAQVQISSEKSRQQSSENYLKIVAVICTMIILLAFLGFAYLLISNFYIEVEDTVTEEISEKYNINKGINQKAIGAGSNNSIANVNIR